MKSTAPHWIAIAILTAILAGIGIKFIVLGSTTPGDDGRTAILLEPGERQLVLGEMRALLEASQQIVDALASNDLKAVATAAAPVGSQAISTMDFRLKARLPIEFKQLGFATHYAFDDIARMAKAGKPATDIQRKLADTMQHCIACHASFQLPQQH